LIDFDFVAKYVEVDARHDVLLTESILYSWEQKRRLPWGNFTTSIRTHLLRTAGRRLLKEQESGETGKARCSLCRVGVT